MEVGRRRKRPKGPPLYNLSELEDTIRKQEWLRAESMHDAAEKAENRHWSPPGSVIQPLESTLLHNLSLNAWHEEWNKATRLHALVAVTYISRYHSFFRCIDVGKVFSLIFRFACMPSVPDTGPAPTVRQLWAHPDGELWRARIQRARQRSVLAFYNRVLPGVRF